MIQVSGLEAFSFKNGFDLSPKAQVINFIEKLFTYLKRIETEIFDCFKNADYMKSKILRDP